MWNKYAWFVALCSLMASTATAQTVNADRYRLATGPCMLRSGSGTPEGAVTGNVCDLFISTTTGVWYTKWTGSGNTGWGVGHNANARVNGDTDITGYVGVPGYVSQLTGWRVTAAGAGDLRYLYTDELHAKLFIADLEQALAGGQVICKSVTLLGSNFTNPATSGTATLTVRDLPSAENVSTFQSGDYVGLRAFTRTAGSLTIAETFGVVTAYADQAGGVQTWTFTRGAGANGGSMATSTVVATDAIVIDYGVSGNGCHEINAIDGANSVNSPYAQTWTWTTSPIVANRNIRTRVGNLLGITAVAGEYGLFAGSGGTSTDTFLIASSTRVLAQNIDISLNSGGVTTVSLNHFTPSFALGSAVPSAYATGTGIWMGNDGGTYKFRVGVPGGAGLFWDGSALTVRGSEGWGRNQIPNSECKVSTENWVGGTDSGLSLTLSFNNLSGFRLNDEPSTCFATVAGTPAVSTVTQVYTDPIRFPVQAASRYEASAYLGVHRAGNTYVSIQWYDSAAAFISSSVGNNCTDGAAGGFYLTNFCRSGVVATAPTGAVRALVLINQTYTGGQADPYVFWVRAFFGEATSTQTELTAWGAAGTTEITGGLIKTGAITASKITAGTITANEIAANTITAAKIAAGTITATEIAASTITAAKIASGAITADMITTGSMSAARITSGTMSADRISGGTISGNIISGGTINGVDIVAGDLTADTLNGQAWVGGGTRFACINNSGDIYSSTSACN